jgi:CRP-like cAMP-binding protein
MALDAMRMMADERRLSFIEHSCFPLRLSNSIKVLYDFNHMNIDPFSQLPAKASRTLNMEKGDLLFHQNQMTSGLYRVVSGCVVLQRTGISGDTLTLHKAVSGSLFAEASVFSATYHCDAVCSKVGSVVKVAKAEILSALQTNPEFAIAFAKLLAVQVQSYRSHIELLAIPSANERILAAILAGYFEGTVIELATRINLTHEACYRALRALCEDGRLSHVGRGDYRLS